MGEKDDIKERAEKAFVAVEAQDEATAKLFNPKALATKNKQLFSKTHPVFGVVTYGKITMEELDEINADLEKMNKKDDRTMRTLLMLWKMLQKGCPELSLEDVRTGFSFDEVSELLTFLTEGNFFLNVKR